MPSVLLNTPLVSLDVRALDTETTGLDVTQARILEIGIATRTGDPSWSSLVKPDIAIPPSSTRIHGITDAMVSAALPFKDIWPEVERQISGHVLLGHSLGFDFAVLKSNAQRAGLRWSEPQYWLDTRLLAQLLRFTLPDSSIRTLAAYLGLPPGQNHRALADAEQALRVFERLLPPLRDRGIHTLGEALNACRRLEQATLDMVKAGWSEPPRPLLERPDSQKTDTYPYRHRVRDLMSAPAMFISPVQPLNEALTLMAERKISSLMVGDAEDKADDVGIITERDVLRALAKQGATALSEPIGPIASRPLATILDGAFVYRAIGRMAARNIRHLAVKCEDSGRIVGVLSQRDLLRLRAQSAVVLGDDVDTAETVAELGRAWAKLPAMARALREEEVSATDIAGIIARELGALTRRAAIIGARRMEGPLGLGPAPCRYAVTVLGSAGRGESLLAMDQDNAIIFAEGDPDGTADRWFARLGREIADILHEVGVPYCKGGVMASEPGFRGSVSTWRARMQAWLQRSSPADLLNVDIVFDMRTVHGDPDLARHLLLEFRAAAASSPAFLKLLAESHGDAASPIGFFGRLKGDEDGRIDIKKHVLSRAVAGARVLALRHDVAARETPLRLDGVRALDKGSARDLEAMSNAYRRGLDLLLRAQLQDIAEGLKPSNRIPLALATQGESAALKDDIAQLANLTEIVRDALF